MTVVHEYSMVPVHPPAGGPRTGTHVRLDVVTDDPALLEAIRRAVGRLPARVRPTPATLTTEVAAR